MNVLKQDLETNKTLPLFCPSLFENSFASKINCKKTSELSNDVLLNIQRSSKSYHQTHSNHISLDSLFGRCSTEPLDILCAVLKPPYSQITSNIDLERFDDGFEYASRASISQLIYVSCEHVLEENDLYEGIDIKFKLFFIRWAAVSEYANTQVNIVHFFQTLSQNVSSRLISLSDKPELFMAINANEEYNMSTEVTFNCSNSVDQEGCSISLEDLVNFASKLHLSGGVTAENVPLPTAFLRFIVSPYNASKPQRVSCVSSMGSTMKDVHNLDNETIKLKSQKVVQDGIETVMVIARLDIGVFLSTWLRKLYSSKIKQSSEKDSITQNDQHDSLIDKSKNVVRRLTLDLESSGKKIRELTPDELANNLQNVANEDEYFSNEKKEPIGKNRLRALSECLRPWSQLTCQYSSRQIDALTGQKDIDDLGSNYFLHLTESGHDFCPQSVDLISTISTVSIPLTDACISESKKMLDKNLSNHNEVTESRHSIREHVLSPSSHSDKDYCAPVGDTEQRSGPYAYFKRYSDLMVIQSGSNGVSHEPWPTSFEDVLIRSPNVPDTVSGSSGSSESGEMFEYFEEENYPEIQTFAEAPEEPMNINKNENNINGNKVPTQGHNRISKLRRGFQKRAYKALQVWFKKETKSQIKAMNGGRKVAVDNKNRGRIKNLFNSFFCGQHKSECPCNKTTTYDVFNYSTAVESNFIMKEDSVHKINDSTRTHSTSSSSNCLTKSDKTLESIILGRNLVTFSTTDNSAASVEQTSKQVYRSILDKQDRVSERLQMEAINCKETDWEIGARSRLLMPHPNSSSILKKHSNSPRVDAKKSSNDQMGRLNYEEAYTLPTKVRARNLKEERNCRHIDEKAAAEAISNHGHQRPRYASYRRRLGNESSSSLHDATATRRKKEDVLPKRRLKRRPQSLPKGCTINLSPGDKSLQPKSCPASRLRPEDVLIPSRGPPDYWPTGSNHNNSSSCIKVPLTKFRSRLGERKRPPPRHTSSLMSFRRFTTASPQTYRKSACLACKSTSLHSFSMPPKGCRGSMPPTLLSLHQRDSIRLLRVVPTASDSMTALRRQV